MTDDCLVYLTLAWPTKELPRETFEKMANDIAGYVSLIADTEAVKWELNLERKS
jgi:hypothetical protein